jgi:copper chaperone CopZ
MLLRSIWVWLVIGVIASAAIEQFVPAGALEKFGAGGGLPAMLVALIIGMPLYVCTTASVPIAAALVHNGFPPGAAMVFLIRGPATNLATMGAIYRVLGGHTLGKYLATIAVGSLTFGLLFNLLIDPASAKPEHVHDVHSWWATLCAAALVALLAWFAIDDARARMARRRRAKDIEPAEPGAAAPRTVEVAVRGMTCGSCVSRLERVIGRAPGVSSVKVSLEPGRAIVEGDVTDQRLRELVESAGFQTG